jgi:hypothetical protein
MAQPPTIYKPGKLNYVWNYLGKTLKEFSEALTTYSSGSKLSAGTRELVLNDTGLLLLNTGDLTIATDPINGDDILINATDRATIQAGDKLLNDENTGGNAYFYAGDGSSSDGIANAGDGGNVRVYAGDAGTSTSGTQAFGGDVTIRGGYTTQTASTGGIVYIQGGASVDNIEGSIFIGSGISWIFNPNNGTIAFPLVNYSMLPAAPSSAGMRAMINDSPSPAVGNFGNVASGAGAFVVPVFSDGSNWVIG